MSPKPAPASHLKRTGLFLALVIGELLALVALFLWAPAAVLTAEMLGPLFVFLLQILARA